MSQYLLHLSDVYKSYGSKLVLDNIDLKVQMGEFCTVVGPSGCGKSTLLRLILGQEMASQGRILFEGQDIEPPNVDRGIVFQKYSLYPNRTVLENVMLGKKLQAGLIKGYKKRKEIKQEAVNFLKRVRLEKHLNKYPHELSGGMQQRVSIAQALIMKPKILLMDEPFGALDPGTREDMQLFLLELWQETKMTIFFVTHDLEEALFIGTRLLVVSQFYTDDREQERQPLARGAKIVADYDLKKSAQSVKLKQTAEFSAMMAKVRQEGFDPDFRQHAKEFNLKHPDAFQSLTPREFKT